MTDEPKIPPFDAPWEVHVQAIRDFCSNQPLNIACQTHPEVKRLLIVEKSKLRTAFYSPCPKCEQAQALMRQNESLHQAGVPSNLLHATLQNWRPRDDAERAHLEVVERFTQTRRGFLLLLGTVGVGKTHLAVGAMRYFRNPFFRKQSGLLKMLRETYRSDDAPDPVIMCQRADLLVLDEVGLSAGGRDEVPLIHDVLDFRHGEFLPTILTSNLGANGLRELLGPRLSDRIRESGFSILNFDGESHRAELNARYFEQGAPAVRLPYKDD